ncbi:MAG: HNH endonuclease [Sedimentisphaerales bacterium]|nr:HNH endonuclease [Sedimentisphaerales bacterium]
MATKRGQPRTCANCVYACPLRDGSRTLLVCANTPDAPGGLVRIEPESTCPNFRPKRGPVVRLEPPEPPNDEIRYIPLTRGKFAIVAAADYEWLSQYKWLANGDEHRGFYAGRRVGNKLVLMHRLIMNAPEGSVVDHKNHNSLNNRRRNLRLCTQKENSRNAVPNRRGTSRFKGVYFLKRTGKWIATINYNGKTMHLGSFDDEIEAAKAYDRKAHELFGEFAYLNFPEDYA